jgi:CO dehydrogenase nickel-insertion accessory protein CooC1
MDTWKITVMGDGGVGKTTLTVQVRFQASGLTQIFSLTARLKFTLDCFIGENLFTLMSTPR